MLPVFHFTLDVAPGGGPIEPRIRGAAGEKEFVRAELMGLADAAG